jgi:hypothetical protein
MDVQPTKNVSIGIDPYPTLEMMFTSDKSANTLAEFANSQ